MMPNQTLHDLTANGISRLQPVMDQVAPDLVLVQGDTTTTLIGALCAYYAQVKADHIEAGLRSGDRFSPFPEEINRRLTDQLTDFHFAPTEKARQFLLGEGMTDKVFTVGNTVIDALVNGRQSDQGTIGNAVLRAFKHGRFRQEDRADYGVPTGKLWRPL